MNIPMSRMHVILLQSRSDMDDSKSGRVGLVPATVRPLDGKNMGLCLLLRTCICIETD